MKCKDCNETLEESEFDRRIGECPKCHNNYTDKEYADILKLRFMRYRTDEYNDFKTQDR